MTFPLRVSGTDSNPTRDWATARLLLQQHEEGRQIRQLQLHPQLSRLNILSPQLEVLHVGECFGWDPTPFSPFFKFMLITGYGIKPSVSSASESGMYIYLKIYIHLYRTQKMVINPIMSGFPMVFYKVRMMFFWVASATYDLKHPDDHDSS